MDERKAQERIHKAVRDDLSWLDKLPSRETEILEQTKKEADPLITVMNGNTETMVSPAFAPASHHTRTWFRPVLAVAAVLVLITGFWAVQHSSFVGGITTDVVTQPAGSEETPGLPAAVVTDELRQPEPLPLDRIDLYVEPDLLWNSETGILTEGEDINKSKLPFTNTVYRKMKDSGVKVDGEMVYCSDEGAVLFRDQIKLCLDGDFSLDMPQKSFLIDAADGSFDFPLFDDRSATSYPSLLLRNSGNDSMFTRIQDGVQHRLIERHTDAKLLTQAWRPVQVYLNDEYWGMYNMREAIDGHTVCRYENVSDELADSVSILTMNGSSIQGQNKEYKELLETLKNSNPAETPADLEYLEQEVDIDSFLDWLTVEMYFGNSDIGTGQMYRIPGGKWKCLITDLDYGLYDSGFDSVKSYLKDKGMGVKEIDNTIFLKILSADKYKDLFFTKLGNLFYSLTSGVMESEVDACVAWIEPGMKAHIDRWAPFYDKQHVIMDAPTSPEAAWKFWEQRVARLRNVIRKRPTLLYNFIQEYFGMTDEEMAVYFPTDIPRTVDKIPNAV